MTVKKIISIVSVVVVTALIGYGIKMYLNIFSENTKFNQSEVYVHIPTDANYEDVKRIMQEYVKDIDNFDLVASKRSYTQNVKPGRFLLKKGMNSFELVTSMRQNVAVKLSFNNQERLENFAGRVGAEIEADSLELLTSFQDSLFLKENGFTKENVLCICIPNTYELYWNTKANKFRDKMLKEYRNFWNDERIALAEKQGLNPIQATILASIVHKETVKKDERPRVAGVYLNRLKSGTKLEADPTVIFAKKLKLNDFNLVMKRVLYADLAIDSPFNTYFYEGLPPGPIAMPDITAIEAVLKPENHNYIYFCASTSRFGYHEFAVTLAQHEANRKKYVTWLNGFEKDNREKEMAQ